VGDDRELEEATCRETAVTVAATVCRQDPPPEKLYGLSDQGMLLSQAKVDEDKEPTTSVPPTDNEVHSQPKFAGITQYSNVMK
jgi:tRNA-binding EMAP/Myf-like protein